MGAQIFLHRKMSELGIGKAFGQFNLSFTTNIKEDDIIAVLDAADRLAATIDRANGLHSLVVFAAAVCCADGFRHGKLASVHVVVHSI